MTIKKENLFLHHYFPLLDKMSSDDKIIFKNLSLKNSLDSKKILSFMLVYAVKNNKKEWIEKFMSHEDFRLNDIIDPINNKTLLANIIYYPFYVDLFRKLIDMGADIHKNQVIGDPLFRSNALMLSVHYNEFENLHYLLKKNLVTNDEVLSMCIERKNFTLLRYFLEETSNDEARVFIEKRSSDKNIERVQKVLSEHLRKIEDEKIA